MAKKKYEQLNDLINQYLESFEIVKTKHGSNFTLELKREDLRLTVDNPEDLIVCKAVYKEFIKDAPQIPINKIIKFLDMNHSLKELIFPFTEKGYESMYVWSDNE